MPEPEDCGLDQQLEAARNFYGPSIDFSKVTVRLTRAVFFGSPAWTCNDVVRIRRPKLGEECEDPSTLIHELGHVWQHQTGHMQVLKGLVEQMGRVFRDPYDYGGLARLKRAVNLTDFNNESQAQIVQEYWKFLNGYSGDRMGVEFTEPEYVANLQRLVQGAGIGTKPPDGGRSIGVAIDSAVAKVVNVVLRPFD